MSTLEEQVDAMIDALRATSHGTCTAKGKRKTRMPKKPRGIRCCPKCMSTKLSYHDPGFGPDYKPGTDIGVVYGEHITGCFSWDDAVKPIKCDKGHIFYV